MRNSSTTTIGEAIKALLNQYRLEQKFDETTLITSWEKLMGKTIASRTDSIFIKNKKLYVKVNSSPLKNELQINKQKMLDIFNNEIGTGIISEIVLL